MLKYSLKRTMGSLLSVPRIKFAIWECFGVFAG